MTKKSIVLSGLLGIWLAGCGGTPTADRGSEANKAHYVDGFVGGVDYHCGSKSGITDANGTFAFEAGQDCTLSVGEITLRTVASEDLSDGVWIIEGNMTVASFLQTYDADGNLSNGIILSDDARKKLRDKGAKTVNDALSFADASFLHHFSGTPYDEAQAQAHVGHTIEHMMGGKTFYIVAKEPPYSAHPVQTAFNADMTMTGPSLNDMTDPITLRGNRITYPSDHTGNTTVVLARYNEYIQAPAILGGVVAMHTRYYYDKSKAEAYLASLKN